MQARSQRTSRSISLNEAWAELKRVRTEIEDYFANQSPELRMAAGMAAQELAENVLKHGDDTGCGLVTLSQEGSEIVISTQNRVDSPQQARAVRERINRITSEGARELYVMRMVQMLEEPHAAGSSSGSGLGLLRIAYEGSFQLSCELLGNQLRICARRNIEHDSPK